MRIKCAAITGFKDVLSQQSGRIGLLDSFFKGIGRIHVFAAKIIVDNLCADGISGDKRPFNYLVGIALA